MFFIILKSKSAKANSLLCRTFPKFLEKGVSYSVKNENHYDIIVAGGGMIGSTLACTLGKNPRLSNKRILLLEGGKEKEWSIPEKYSNRVVSINPGTFKLLDEINAWSHIKEKRYATVKRLQVWDAVSDASITFGDEESPENVSYVVENNLLLDAVNKEIKKTDKLKVRYGATVQKYQLPEHDTNISQIYLENGEKYTCDLLLGCDGFNSQVRKAMKVDYLSWNYNQKGVVATLKLSESIDNKIAWQRFLPSGPIALLPLTDNLSSLVWSTSPEHAKELLGLPDEQFVDAVNCAIWQNYEKCGVVDQATRTFDSLIRLLNCPSDTVRQYPPKIEAIEVGSRAAFPLGFGHAVSYIRKGVVLVGDAAHRIHPLAGQGVNLGFGDIICLNRILGDIVNSGSKLDNMSYLKEYETERQRHNIPTMLAVEGLHRLYNSAFTPLVLLRSLGLQLTHALSPVKKAIINQAAA